MNESHVENGTCRLDRGWLGTPSFGLRSREQSSICGWDVIDTSSEEIIARVPRGSLYYVPLFVMVSEHVVFLCMHF